MEKEIKKSTKSKVIETIKENNDNKTLIDIEKDELLKKTKEQEEIILKLTKQNDKSVTTLEMLQKQMQDMQTAFIQMQSNSQNTLNANDSKLYELRSRMINGITLYDTKRVVEREIPSGQTIEVNAYEIEILLKSPMVRNFIKDDVVYFVDESNYKQFKFFEHGDLSDEFIKSLLLNSSSEQLIIELDKLTKNKRNHSVLHTIFYRIVDLYTNGSLHGMNFNSKILEKYFRFDFDSASQLVERVKQVM